MPSAPRPKDTKPQTPPSIKVGYAQRDALEWLILNDPYVTPEWVGRCLALGEYIIAEDAEGGYFGFLRFSQFWGGIPYMDMIRVPEENLREKGIGTALFHFWEDQMAEKGARVLMTSAQMNETAPQKWHTRNGFAPSGRLTFGPIQEQVEMFFIKNLEDDAA